MNKETIKLTEEGYALMQQELDQAQKTLYEEIPEKLKASKLNGGDPRRSCRRKISAKMSSASARASSFRTSHSKRAGRIPS